MMRKNMFGGVSIEYRDVFSKPVFMVSVEPS